MENRRIAIYLDSRKALAQVQLNHSYSAKIAKIIFKEGISKAEAGRRLLMKSFQTEDILELQERISYAASLHQFKAPRKGSTRITGLGSKISYVCKLAIKKAIDSY
jgi:hypothetical protein